MNKLKFVLLFGAIGLVLATASGVIGYYHGSVPDCADKYNLACELGPPSAKIGLPFAYTSGSVNVITDNELVDKHFVEGQIIFEPRNLFGVFNSEMYMSTHNGLPGVVYFFIDTVFWGSVSWLIYWLINRFRNRYNKTKT